MKSFHTLYYLIPWRNSEVEKGGIENYWYNVQSGSYQFSLTAELVVSFWLSDAGSPQSTHTFCCRYNMNIKESGRRIWILGHKAGGPNYSFFVPLLSSPFLNDSRKGLQTFLSLVILLGLYFILFYLLLLF